tara:strand:- start:226 stop:390 length:165 start_codon:yes stop_codon:yes gene_type:complete
MAKGRAFCAAFFIAEIHVRKGLGRTLGPIFVKGNILQNWATFAIRLIAIAGTRP